MKTQKPSEFAKLANEYAEKYDYAEKYYGTRAAAFLEEGNAERAWFKAQALDEFVSLQNELKVLMQNYPLLNDNATLSITFWE